MSNDVILITGALTGIGRAAALAFAREGGRLVVAGRHEEAGEALAAELRSLGAEAEFIGADVHHEDVVYDSGRRGTSASPGPLGNAAAGVTVTAAATSKRQHESARPPAESH